MTQISILKVLCTLKKKKKICKFKYFSDTFFLSHYIYEVFYSFYWAKPPFEAGLFCAFSTYCWQVTSWLPFSPAESVFDNVIILTTCTLYLSQEQDVLQKTPRFRKETYWQWYHDTAQGRVLFEPLCLCMKSYELCSEVTCLLYHNKCRCPDTQSVSKVGLGRSLEGNGNAVPDLLLIYGLKCNLLLFVTALFPQGGEPNCITKRVKSCSAFGSCRLDWLNYSEQTA